MTIKLRSLLEENNILVPRNLESRKEKQKQIYLQRIQEYIKNGSKGDLDLRGTPLTKLPDNLTRVDRTLYIRFSSIEDLNNLEYVGEYLFASRSKLKFLPPKLTRINGSLSLTNCPLNNIGSITYIRYDLWIGGTNINELPRGLIIGGDLHYNNTPLSEKYPNLESLRKYLEERNIKVGGDIYL